MSPVIRSVVVPVSDLEAAKAVYGALLGDPHTDQPYYVGYSVDGFEVSLNPAGSGGPVAYADVDDLDATRQTLIAAGAERLSVGLGERYRRPVRDRRPDRRIIGGKRCDRVRRG